ncbi:MAG: LD-carboxypeptidase [Lachnospiraceae bacterium]|nr:LD-carboxypeptidase [Lachnospiraceae bacterium]
MRYGKFLERNGVIAVTAPSYGAGIEPYISRFSSAEGFFRGEGFRVIVGETCHKTDGIGISTDPATCGRELTDFYCSADNDMIISAGGGELMCETIDHVDWDRIRKAPPKWYLGYSDNTNMTFLLPTICDTAAIYGECFSAFGRKPMDAPMRDLVKLLKGETLSVHSYDKWEKPGADPACDPLSAPSCTEDTLISSFNWNGLPFGGRMIGGCLDILTMYPGTKFDRVKDFIDRYKDDGIVWFLEACDFNVYGIRRALWILKHAGWFENARGFLFGRPLCMGQETFDGLNQYNAVLDVLEDLDVPILMDLDIGHVAPQMPMISGAVGTVYRCRDRVEIGFELR